MADGTSAVGGVNSSSNNQPINENDFAYLKKTDETKKTDDKTKQASDKKEEEQKESIFKAGEMSEETVKQVMEIFNELMEKINCDIEFSYDKKADMFNVKMIDKKSGEVLKEFPPEEMLENISKSKELRGAIINMTV